jgi:outer membrane protein assembly factor BamB
MLKRPLKIPIFLTALFVAGLLSPASADEDRPETALGILTPPSLDSDVLYFAGWGGKLYAFDEAKNQARWEVSLSPLPSQIDPDDLPAPPPFQTGSYILVHLGRQLWGVSKVDGRSVWCVDNLPPASNRNLRRTSNPLPGFQVYYQDELATVLTLEENEMVWFLRGRRLGDGSMEWEAQLVGEPCAWWLEKDSLWVVTRSPGESGNGPGVVTQYDPHSGQSRWASPIVPDASFRAALRTDGRVFLLEKTGPDFYIRAFSEESGELKRTIFYQGGEFIDALGSDDKLAFFHEEGEPDQKLVRLSMYYSSLNPIRFQTVRRSREDQVFVEPAIDGNLVLYGGTAYELYDGNMVWKEDDQLQLIDWAADADHVYLWLGTDELVALERLTSLEIWRISLEALPPGQLLGADFGGASLTLVDGRLFAGSPIGELFRVDAATGAKHPGIIRVPGSIPIESLGKYAGPANKSRAGGLKALIWLVSLAVLVSAALLVVKKRRNALKQEDRAKF